MVPEAYQGDVGLILMVGLLLVLLGMWRQIYGVERRVYSLEFRIFNESSPPEPMGPPPPRAGELLGQARRIMSGGGVPPQAVDARAAPAPNSPQPQRIEGQS